MDLVEGWTVPFGGGGVTSAEEGVRCCFVAGKIDDESTRRGGVEGGRRVNEVEFGGNLELVFVVKEGNREWAKSGVRGECVDKA